MLPSQNPCCFSWYTRRNVSPSPYTLRVRAGCMIMHRSQYANMNGTTLSYVRQALVPGWSFPAHTVTIVPSGHNSNFNETNMPSGEF